MHHVAAPGVWKLPAPWTHRTRPPRVAKPQTVSHSSHTHHRLSFSEDTKDQNLSVCWSATHRFCGRGRDSKVLHNSSRWSKSVGAKSLNTSGIELKARIVVGVCDNQTATARKLLILKTERCWSGRSGTLGKRFRRASLSDTRKIEDPRACRNRRRSEGPTEAIPVPSRTII